ncbi:MAG TPA: aminodeoxychorismate synthase component I [Candidatus Altiarchaeales archaeon]|nr:aminodeoxychorismate synthase component I [Candidatus Altiarchaeales archaeon]
MVEMKAVVRDVSKHFEGHNVRDLFEKISSRPYSILLESGAGPKKISRYSIMSCNPGVIVRSLGEKIEVVQDGSVKKFNGDPLEFLDEKLGETKTNYTGDIPFIGGAVGYFSYDLCWLTEGVKTTGKDEFGMWDMEFGFYDKALVFDHHEDKKYIVSTSGEKEEKEFLTLFDKEPASSDESDDVRAEDLNSNFSKDEYFKAVEKVRNCIREGDIYQANLSQQFTAKTNADSWTIYKKLYQASPAPFSAYLNFGGVKIISSSPERFLKIRGGIVETRPIKGTRPRGKTRLEDEKLKKQLAESGKDRAEHLMIVDLERNDLGKVCEYGSVKVAELEAIESYADVHHMVSTIRGKIRRDKSIVDCIRACFPGGSITGAPKHRSMEVIDEIEPAKRGVYTGALGYIGFNETCDLNIVIRTMILKDGKIRFNVGGGVVYDSTPAGEYEETFDKARGILKSIGLEGRWRRK